MRHKREAAKYRTPEEEKIKKRSINGALLNKIPGFSPASSDINDKRLLFLLQEDDNRESVKSLKQDDISSLSAEEQYEAVKNQYYGTNKYMIAPNGRASNLTERQWIQTRTPSFLNWGGDWINNPESASVILDENGEPKRFYHGSISSFDTFREGENGIYFTDNKEAAWSYGAHSGLYEVFLKADETFEMDFEGESDTEETESRYALETEARYAKENGYDSVIAYNTFDGENNLDQYIVFSSSQIKSATNNNGDFSLESDSILKQDGGYDHQKHMSNRAVSAYAGGEMPMSKWTKAALNEAIEISSASREVSNILTALPLEAKRALLNYSSWHHTSIFYNATDFYEMVDLSNVTPEQAQKYSDAYKQYKVPERAWNKAKKEAERNLKPNQKLIETTYNGTRLRIDTYENVLEGVDIPADIKNFAKQDLSYSLKGNAYIRGTKPSSSTVENGLLRLELKDDGKVIALTQYNTTIEAYGILSLVELAKPLSSIKELHDYLNGTYTGSVVSKEYSENAKPHFSGVYDILLDNSLEDDSTLKQENIGDGERATLQFVGKTLQSYSLSEDDIQRLISFVNRTPVDITDDATNEKTAEEAYRKIKSVKNLETKDEVAFVNTTFGKIKRHKGYDPRLIGNLESLFRDATFLFDEPAEFVVPRGDGTLHKKKNNIVSYSNYGTKVRIDGEDYFVRYTTQNLKSKHKGIGERQFHSQQLTSIKISNLPMTSPLFVEAEGSVASDYKLASLLETVNNFVTQNKVDLDTLQSQSQKNIEEVAESGTSLKQIGDDEWTETAKRIALEAGSLEDFFKLYRDRIDSGDIELSDSNTTLLLSDIYEESRSNEYTDYDEYYDEDYEESQGEENETDVSDEWIVEEVEDNPSYVSTSSMPENVPDWFDIGVISSAGSKILSSDDTDTAYVKRWLGTNFSEDSSENNFMAAIVKAAAKARGMDGQSFIEKYFTEIEESQEDDANTKGYMFTKRDEVTKQVKATIYAGKNADATTFLHELHHAIMLMGDNMKEFTQIYNKVKGTKQFRAFLEENIDLLKERIARKDSDGKFITDEKGRYSIDETKLNSLYKNSEKWTEDDFEFEARLYEAYIRNGFFKVKLNDEDIAFYGYDASTVTTSSLNGSGDMQFLDDAIEKNGDVADATLKSGDINLDENGLLRWKNVEKYLVSQLDHTDGKSKFALVRNNTGKDYKITKKTIGKMLSDVATNKSVANGFSINQHNEAVANVKTLFENSILVETSEDKRGSRSIKSIERFETNFTYKGDSNTYTAYFTAKTYTEEGEKGSLYSVELKDIKNTSDKNGVARSTDTVELNHIGGLGEASLSTPFNNNIDDNGESVKSLKQDVISQLSAEEQYEAVKNQYYGTNKYMIAPNGRASNLTERQWIQVRTPNFKEWFGDWGNDPQNASKVLDYNGAFPLEDDSILKQENIGDGERATLQFVGKDLQSYSLNNNDVSRLTSFLDSTAIDISDDETTRDNAESTYRQIGTVTNIQTGDNVQFVRSSFGKIERHKDYDPRLIGKLVRLFGNATFLFDEAADYDTPRGDGTLHKKKSNVGSFSNYGIKIILDGEEYFVRYTIQNIKNRNDRITGRQFHSQQLSSIKTSNLPMTSSSSLRAGRSVASDYKLASLLETVNNLVARNKADLAPLKSQIQQNLEEVAKSGSSLKQIGDDEWTEDDFEFEVRLYEAYIRNGFFKVKLNDEVVEYLDKLYGYDASTGAESILSDSGDMQFLDDAVLKQDEENNPYKPKSFDEEIKDIYEKRGKSQYKEIVLSKVSDVYRDIGIHGEEFRVKRGSIIRHRTKDGHLATADEWIALADNFNKPIGYFIDEEGKYHIYFNVRNKSGETLMALIEERKTGPYSTSNYVVTAFYRRNYDRDIITGLIKKINQPSVQWHQSPSDLPSSADSKSNISLSSEPVKGMASTEFEAGDATVLKQDDISQLSAEEQYEAVKNQYYGTDKYMIAPNGRASNLTERQWIQVRTPNFKEWLGDWKNDPQNASKVLDENGEPKQLYHGTFKNGYIVFEGKRGIYFTSDRTTAESYAIGLNKGVCTVFLKADTPLTIDAEGSKWSALRLEGSREYKKTLGTTILSPADIASYAKDSDTPYDRVIIRNIREGNDDTVKNIADDYIVFSPSQIKSATDNNGEFSIESDSILKQEGNEEANAGYRNAVDLSEEFSLIKSGEITAEDVENYIKGLINQVFDTATNPLQIKITAGNKSHIVESNVVLVGNKRERHEDIERIINKAERTHRDGTVNADHNSKRTKNRKLKHIAEYVYFETPVMIGDESRRLNQDENLLNLYNVRVKKNNFAGTNTKIVVSQTGASDSVSSDTQSVKSLTKAEKEALHQTDACRNYEDFQIKARSNIDIVLAIAGSVASGDITKSQQNTRHLGKGNIRSISAIKYYIINEGENSDANRRSKTYASAPHVRLDQMATSLNDRLRQLLENRITLAISGVGAERGKSIEEAAVSEIVLKEIENAGITEVDVYICTVQTPRLSLSGVVKKINQPSVQWHQLPSVLPPSADLINLRAYSASGIPEERRKNVQHPQHTSVLNSNIGGKWREVKRLNCINLSIFSLIEGIPTRFVFVGDGYGLCGTFMREGMSALC